MKQIAMRVAVTAAVAMATFLLVIQFQFLWPASCPSGVCPHGSGAITTAIGLCAILIYCGGVWIDDAVDERRFKLHLPPYGEAMTKETNHAV